MIEFDKVKSKWKRPGDNALFANLFWSLHSLKEIQSGAVLSKDDWKRLESTIHRLEGLLKQSK